MQQEKWLKWHNQNIVSNYILNVYSLCLTVKLQVLQGLSPSITNYFIICYSKEQKTKSVPCPIEHNNHECREITGLRTTNKYLFNRIQYRDQDANKTNLQSTTLFLENSIIILKIHTRNLIGKQLSKPQLIC